MRIECQSPCKVNFLLNILGKRPDGFHDLETVFHPVPLFDLLELERGGEGIRLTCNHPELPTDRGNLVFRAAEAFLAAAKISEGVSLRLEKRVPLAAGLGGGSSNAAHTLSGLNELFGQPLGLEELNRLAAELGSDVPFFLQNQPALGVGRGEVIRSLPPFERLRGAWILLIHPGFGISTAWAYQQLARFPEALNGVPGRAMRLIEALRAGGLDRAKTEFYNSLEAPALYKYPVLEVIQEFLREAGADIALMSGSGSTTFALIRDQPLAETVLEKFKGEFGPTYWTALAPL